MVKHYSFSLTDEKAKKLDVIIAKSGKKKYQFFESLIDKLIKEGFNEKK